VPRDISTPVGTEHGAPRIEQIGPVAARADGVDTGMFHHQQGFGFTVGGNPGNEPFLEEESGLEVHYSAVDDL
jgi:hypothetical protein